MSFQIRWSTLKRNREISLHLALCSAIALPAVANRISTVSKTGMLAWGMCILCDTGTAHSYAFWAADESVSILVRSVDRRDRW